MTSAPTLTRERFAASPTSYAAPDHVQALLDLKDPMLLTNLLASGTVRPRIDEKLSEMMGEIPTAPRESQKVFLKIATSTPKELSVFAMTVGALINHKAIMATTDGQLIARATQPCGGKKIIETIRNTNLPELPGLVVLLHVTEDNLQLFKMKAYSLILGALPDPYYRRMLLRFETDILPERQQLECHQKDQKGFLAYLKAGLNIIKDMELNNAPD